MDSEKSPRQPHSLASSGLCDFCNGGCWNEACIEGSMIAFTQSAKLRFPLRLLPLSCVTHWQNSQDKNAIAEDYAAIAGNMLAMIVTVLAKHTLTL